MQRRRLDTDFQGYADDRDRTFDDPLFVLQDASRNEERRDAVIGFSSGVDC